MAHPDSLAAEIEAVEKEIYGNPSDAPAANVNQPNVVLETDGHGNPVGSPEAPEGTSEGVEAPTKAPAEPAVQTGVVAPAEPSEGVVTPQPPAEAQPQPPSEDWEKRYKGYKASSDATIHGLRQEALSLRELVQQQDDKISQLESKLEETAQPQDSGLQFTPEEREVIGEDTIKALEKANLAAEAKLKPLKDKLKASEDARRKEKADQLKRDRQDAHTKFIASVKAAVPNFEKIDKNPSFKDWMSGADKASGLLREQLFRKAQAAGDVERVAGFFHQFEELFMKGRRTEESRVAPESAPAGQTTRAPQDNQGQPVITQEFIDKFYNDARRGKYRGRLKEQQEIEQMIDNHLRALAANNYQQ
jgi:hypothetical protein